jgi:prevent-host-death family protein
VALASAQRVGHIGHVQKTSLAHAKAHLSELVDAAEHRGKRIVILRHGKPAAALVPVDVARPKRSRAKRMTPEESERSIRAFVDEFSSAEPETSAVEDLIQGRR